MGASAPVAPGSDCELILVRVGSQELAIDVMSVQEIRGWTAPTRLIQAPAWVDGVIDLRGTALPIIDLGKRLAITADGAALPPRRGDSVIIVVQSQTQQFGLVVDGVSELLRVQRADIRPTPIPITGGAARCVTGLITHGERMLSVIAPESLLSDATAAALEVACWDSVAA